MWLRLATAFHIWKLAWSQRQNLGTFADLDLPGLKLPAAVPAIDSISTVGHAYVYTVDS